MSQYQLVATMGLTLIAVFGVMFALLFGIGFYYNLGIYTMVGFGIAISLIQWYVGPIIIKKTMKMKPLDETKYPWLKEYVEHLCTKNSVPFPKLLISNTSAPNACVFGRTTKSCNLAVTRGLIDQLSQDEVKAVIAHEVGHIKHKDMIVMTVISVIPTIAYMISISTMFSGMMGGGGRGNNNGGGAILIGIGAFVVYFVTNLLILYFSRLREFYTDHFAGLQTGRPSLLASALAKISYGITMESQREKRLGYSARQMEEGQHVSERAFFIADPVSSGTEFLSLAERYKKQNQSKGESQRQSSSLDLGISDTMVDKVKTAMEQEKQKKQTNMLYKVTGLFMTHPHTYQRIERLWDLEQQLNAQSSSNSM